MNKLNNRIETLDFLRGFALLGIILVNIIAIAQLPAPELSNDITYKKFLDFFIESKFFAIFSYLFGIGFYIFMQRAEHKTGNKYVIFLRRIIILGIFGFLHMQLQPGEALLLYAIFGLLLMPFFKLNKYINFTIGLIVLVLFIWLDAKFLIPFPYFILGLASAQFGIIFKFDTASKVWSVVAISSGIISIIGWYVLNKFYVVPYIDLLPRQLQKSTEDYIAAVDKYHHLITIFSPFMSLFYISCLILLLNMAWGRFILAPLKYYGRMALTNYIGQTLIIYLLIIIFDGKHWSLLQSLWICLTIYIVQIITSMLWLKYFKLGPLEYIWKLATYMKWINMKK
ncbi:hypothetical protein CW744_08380 [Staphylococcus xylosus]|uniref:DUF418 domain-containing protein n=1 Tax=Staphylococcus xylosus TaxID=1288 RepID=UPI000C33F1A6|nr:DUF418 domain-containing protein [Staphylococcus xylosus]PKI04633.1 hypothetical protein CW744_08380 [Staphylococcus xylosus]